MSLPISKLVNLDASITSEKKDMVNQSELPDRSNNITKSRYYQSVKNPPKNVGSVLQFQTPAGKKGAPYGKVEVPIFSQPDGAIDPNAIRSKTDATNTALPYRFAGYGDEDILFGMPESTRSSHNNVGLLRKAQASYQNRQQNLEVRSAPPQIGNQLTASSIYPPPSYEESTGTIDVYKKQKNNSELNETYN